MKRKTDHHLRVLSAQIEALEDQGHLEPGQASEARRTIRRMKLALTGNQVRRPSQARQRLHQAVSDLVKLFTDVNDRRK